MKIYLLMCMEFFKVGLFSLGGGYATLPFLFHIAEKYGWYSSKELTQMFAVSSITPGPVGINIATFAGFKTAGLFGSLAATFSVILPSLILVVIVSKLFKKFKCNFYTQASLYALKPATCAMIAAIGVKLLKDSVIPEKFDVFAFLLFVVMFLISLRYKKDPLFYLVFAALAGFLIKTF